MNVPLFATSLEPHRERIAERLLEVAASGRYILGPEVEAFEREFADYLGVRHVVGVGNGTDALTIALRALGVGARRRGDLPLAHLLRHRRGDRERRRAAGLLRRRPGHRLRHGRRPCAPA